MRTRSLRGRAGICSAPPVPATEAGHSCPANAGRSETRSDNPQKSPRLFAETPQTPLSVTDGISNTFAYTYQATSDLLASITAPEHSFTYDYEPNRILMTIVDNQVGASSVSKYTYRYDGVGRRIDRVDEGSAFTQPAFFDCDYDGKGQVTAADRYLGTDPENPGASVPSVRHKDIGNR